MLKHNQQTHAMQIISDPVAWIDHSYIGYHRDSLSVKERVMMNKILTLSLNFAPVQHDCLSQFEREMLNHWHLLPKAFLLMACYRYQAQVLSHNPIIDSTINVNRFLFSLRYITLLSERLSIDITQPLSSEVLLKQAYKEMRYFFPYLSDAIKQRAEYLFAAVYRLTPNEYEQVIADFLLLRIALNYVNSSR